MQTFLDRIAPAWTPHAGQRDFLLHPAKFKVLACGRRWGKTDACAVQILHALSQAAPTRHLILAPTQDQANLLFERVLALERELPGESPPRKVRRTPYPVLEFGTHVVRARSGSLGRTLRGHEASHMVVDEAAYVPEELISEVAMPMLATSDGALSLLSTPHGRNHFRRFFEMGERGEHGIWSRHAPSWESPWVSKRFLEIQRELISERAFRVEYGAEFLDSVGRVFRTDAVEACLVSRLPALEGAPCVAGVDWARYGDYTTVAVLAGTRDLAALVALERFHGLAWSAAVDRVARFIERFAEARVLCDATGVGDPALEMLQSALPRHHVEGLTFTAAIKQELVDGLAWLIDRAAMRMTPHPDLLRELEHFEATTSPSGNPRLGAVSGYHDDLVVALALAARQLPRSYRPSIELGGTRNFDKL